MNRPEIRGLRFHSEIVQCVFTNSFVRPGIFIKRGGDNNGVTNCITMFLTPFSNSGRRGSRYYIVCAVMTHGAGSSSDFLVNGHTKRYFPLIKWMSAAHK